MKYTQNISAYEKCLVTPACVNLEGALKAFSGGCVTCVFQELVQQGDLGGTPLSCCQYDPSHGT
eukprot:6377168-Amphidinium_carterae.1